MARRGTRSCYVKGCDHPECRAVDTAYKNALRRGSPPPVTSARGLDRMANPLDLSWRSDGACRDKPTEWWYPEPTGNTPRNQRTEYSNPVAEAICRGCPVQAECLSWGLEHEDEGIWGGLTAFKRRRVRKAAGMKVDVITLDPRAVGALSGRHVEAPDPFEVSA